MSRFLAAVVGAGLLATSAAHAQQPAEQPAELKSETPQEPGTGGDGFVAKLRRFADETQIVQRLNGDIDGWYPRLGRMTRGSGLAFGPGYRLHTFDDRIFVDLSAAISTKGYKAVDANVRWLTAFADRIELWTDFRYEDYPQEDFFGMGFSSRLEDRTSYDYDSSNITLRGLVRPVRWLQLGTSVGYLRPDVGPGTDKAFPSIEQLFTDADTPGLTAQPNFLHSTFFGELDLLDARGNPRRGTFSRMSFAIVDDHTLDQFDHRRFDALAVHYVPLVASKKHVVSGRVGTSYVNNETGHRVPFYLLAYVGGVDTIRSYREFRFKDENALWLSGEYKWVALKHVSVIGFIDAGEVRRDWNDIDLTGLKKGYGFGFRVHSEKQTFARFDVGTGGGEGWQMFLKLGSEF
jgi:surface antigen Omp85-like protein